MNKRLLSFLGICKRAGRLVTGAQTVEDAMRTGEVKLVLAAQDLSAHSAGDLRYAAEKYGAAFRELSCSKEELSFALGRHCGAVGIKDSGFSDKIKEILNEQQSNTQ